MDQQAFQYFILFSILITGLLWVGISWRGDNGDRHYDDRDYDDYDDHRYRRRRGGRRRGYRRYDGGEKGLAGFAGLLIVGFFVYLLISQHNKDGPRTTDRLDKADTVWNSVITPSPGQKDDSVKEEDDPDVDFHEDKDWGNNEWQGDNTTTVESYEEEVYYLQVTALSSEANAYEAHDYWNNELHQEAFVNMETADNGKTWYKVLLEQPFVSKKEAESHAQAYGIKEYNIRDGRELKLNKLAVE